MERRHSLLSRNFVLPQWLLIRQLSVTHQSVLLQVPGKIDFFLLLLLKMFSLSLIDGVAAADYRLIQSPGRR